MGQFLNGLSSLERDALRDYATKKYFAQPEATRGEANEWVGNFMENMAKNERGKISDITRAYAKERGVVAEAVQNPTLRGVKGVNCNHLHSAAECNATLVCQAISIRIPPSCRVSCPPGPSDKMDWF